MLRIEKLLTKVKQIDAFALHVGQVSVFPQSGTVCVKDETVQLRKKECEILSFLIRHKNRIISKESLIENIWKEESMPVDSTIAVYIRRIRMRLGKTGYQIKTVRGFGYMISDR
jgi:DNA-binding response OmpR family regulator